LENIDSAGFSATGQNGEDCTTEFKNMQKWLMVVIGQVPHRIDKSHVGGIMR